MKCSSTLIGAATLCLLPVAVSAESSLAIGTRTASPGARAHVDFKIVIPSVLGLSLVEANEPGSRGATLKVVSNGRQVSMSAALTESAAPGYSARVTAAILRAPRRGVIEQSADCAVGAPRAVAAGARRSARTVVDLAPLLCTASTP